jgi:protein gp37
MSENSKIEWCDSTFNPFIGCTKVSPGCDNCYAEKLMDHRMHKVTWGAGQARVRTSAANWSKPIAWNKAHAEFFAEHGRRQRVFCASLADVFDNAVDPAWRRDLFELIEQTPNLDWMLLTKRIGNVRDMVPLPWISKPFQHGPDPTNIYPAGWPANVWLGATVVNQEEADRDIPKLLAVPAARRFLSMEPLLGPVSFAGMFANPADMRDGTNMLEELDWVIVGGESGPGARPMHPDWARSLRDQCAAAGVAFLFKQWGEWGPTWTEAHSHMGLTAPLDPAGSQSLAGTRIGIYPNERIWPIVKLGKKIAGRLLDGVQHDGFPEAQ